VVEGKMEILRNKAMIEVWIDFLREVHLLASRIFLSLKSG
jgi:hypothetical protein